MILHLPIYLYISFVYVLKYLHNFLLKWLCLFVIYVILTCP
jgi:hypothetical protein